MFPLEFFTETNLAGCTREAKSAGYEVKAVYVATEGPSLNLAHILIRVDNGGRFAPILRIASDYTQGLRQLPKVKNLTDDLMLFDNTAHGRDVRLVLTSKLESWSSWHGRYRDGHEKRWEGNSQWLHPIIES